MRFGSIPTPLAKGAIVGHTVRLAEGRMLKKGTVLTERDLDALRSSGLDRIVVAQLEAGDIPEDEAAEIVARSVAGRGVRLAEAATGRSNLHAETDGVLCVERDVIDRINRTDEAVTIATVAPMSRVRAGDLVATIKIIPFAAPRTIVDACTDARTGPAISVAPFRPYEAGLVLTRLSGTRESVLDRAASAQRIRAERTGGRVAFEVRCAHDTAAVAKAISELLERNASPILLLGASAIVDRRDVLPCAVESAGGTVIHLGMPVDPGNLLMFGECQNTPVIGVPGCARSLDRSGFDCILERIAAGLPVTRQLIMDMGVGGLLVETSGRPYPRTGGAGEPAPAPAIAAVVLAAGASSRMGNANKLLVPIDGTKMVARAVDALQLASIHPIVVVTGHDADAVREALAGRDVVFVHNPRWSEGMSTSLRAGIGQLGEDIDGTLIALGDMPFVKPAHIEALTSAFCPEKDRAICVPTWERRRGNPVLFARRFFPEMRVLEGDTGARQLLQKHASVVCQVPMPDRGVTLDVDTPEMLDAVLTKSLPPK